MPTRKLIAYALALGILAALTGWAWLHRRRQARRYRQLHGPRRH